MRIARPLLLLVVLLAWSGAARADRLPSWQDRPVRAAILAWLDAVTDPASPDHIPPVERVAVFDNDGTAACERPHGGSSAFQKDLLRRFVAEGRADGTTAPLQAWLDDDRGALRKLGWQNAYAALNAVFAGMEARAYRDSARAWVARHPHERYGVTVRELYYRPMIELKDLLEEHGFRVWIVTGSTQEYIRAVAPEGFGIPAGQVIGTWTELEYGVEEGGAVLRRTAIQHDNGYEHKPGHIEIRLGTRPVFAAGNSNNDEPMLRWALSGDRRAFGLWIHHDDGKREYDYDRGTDRIEDLVDDHPDGHEVSMKRDWARLFAFD